MFGELLKQWANEQGLQTWTQDHAAVLRNLTKWLNMHAVQQSVQADVLEWCGCEGFTPTMENGKCSVCGKNAHR